MQIWKYKSSLRKRRTDRRGEEKDLDTRRLKHLHKKVDEHRETVKEKTSKMNVHRKWPEKTSQQRHGGAICAASPRI